MDEPPSTADLRATQPRAYGREYPLWLSQRVGTIALLSAKLENQMRLLIRTLLRDFGAEGSAAMVKSLRHDALSAKAAELAQSPNMRARLGSELAEWINDIARDVRAVGHDRNRYLHSVFTPSPTETGSWEWRIEKEWILSDPVMPEHLDAVITRLESLIEQGHWAMFDAIGKLAGPGEGLTPMFPEQMP